MVKTVGDYVQHIENTLESAVGRAEARQFALLLFDYLRGYSRAQMVLYKDEVVTGGEVQFLDNAIVRLLNHEPVQYVIGQTEFLGLVFRVDQRVLIPRPETEELVLWVFEEFSGHACNVLDIGTGSGCIPITIKKHWNKAQVDAWDVSVDALSLASDNAQLNGVDVNFLLRDVLVVEVNLSSYDLIISNPPYITESEKELMASNVLNFEPSIALFVEDDSPLLFYRRIADLSTRALRPGGRLYFEINEAFGSDVCDMLRAFGFLDVALRKDLSDRDRMVRAIWPGV
jgi:release factor glutamine methyltransferase